MGCGHPVGWSPGWGQGSDPQGHTGHALGPGDAQSAPNACPPGAVVSKPPQKQNWCLGSLLLLIVKKGGFFISFFLPAFFRDVSGFSVHETELSSSFCLEIKPGERLSPGDFCPRLAGLGADHAVCLSAYCNLRWFPQCCISGSALKICLLTEKLSHPPQACMPTNIFFWIEKKGEMPVLHLA